MLGSFYPIISVDGVGVTEVALGVGVNEIVGVNDGVSVGVGVG